MLPRVALFSAFALFLVLTAGRGTLGWLTGEGDPSAFVAAAPPEPRSAGDPVVLSKAANGHFGVTASAEGHAIDFLVDTGATDVVLSSATALRLGYHPKATDYSAKMQTANGSVGAMPILLKEIRVNQIVLANVRAAIVPPGALGVNLLGMSFLSRLRKFEFSGEQLILSP